VDQPAKYIVALDPLRRRGSAIVALRHWLGRTKAEPAMWPVPVVVPPVNIEGPLQMSADR